MYPDYRFQPKHDPEKKRKRQAARLATEKAERERLEKLHREQRGISQESAEDAAEVQEKEQMMAARRAQVRAAHHLGHRRSSSVPLPTETYGYPYNSYGHAPYADPFNFANPAIANGPHPATSAGVSGNGITIPSLPTMGNPWYPQGMNTEGPASRRRSNSLGALAPNGSGLHAPQPFSASRGPSPRVSFSGLGGMFGAGGPMGMVGMNTFGMGTRAARQHQLGQMGRRASSTQPVLQHQFASGAFANFGFPSSFPHPDFPRGGPYDFGAGVQQMGDESFTGPDGFVGAVAEGFTNPFAPQTASSNDDGSVSGAQQDANRGFPAPLAPNTMWYDVSVDPMTPVGTSAAGGGSPTAYQQAHVQQQQQHQQHPPALPDVDASLLNPTFNFGHVTTAGSVASGSDSERAPSPTSGTVAMSVSHSHQHVSAPQSAVATNFGVGIFGHHGHGHGHHASHLAGGGSSAPGTGARDSFDFSAFNAIFSEQAQAQDQQQQGTHPLAHAETAPNIYAPTTSEVLPHGASGFSTIAQPVPVRKVALPDVPEGGVAPHSAAGATSSGSVPVSASGHGQTQVQVQTQGYYHSHAAAAYQAQQSQPSSESSASGSPASASAQVPVSVVDYPEQQQQQQQYQAEYAPVQHHSEGIVTGLELLEGPVDVQYQHQQHSAYAAHGHEHQHQHQPQSAVGVDHAHTFEYSVDPHQHQHAMHGYATDLGYAVGMDAYGHGGGYGYAPTTAGASDGSASAGATHVPQAAHDSAGSTNMVGSAGSSHGSGSEPRFSFSDYLHGSPFVNSAAVVN